MSVGRGSTPAHTGSAWVALFIIDRTAGANTCAEASSIGGARTKGLAQFLEIGHRFFLGADRADMLDQRVEHARLLVLAHLARFLSEDDHSGSS